MGINEQFFLLKSIWTLPDLKTSITHHVAKIDRETCKRYRIEAVRVTLFRPIKSLFWLTDICETWEICYMDHGEMKFAVKIVAQISIDSRWILSMRKNVMKM